MKKNLIFPILLRWFVALFLISFGVFKAEAQGTWTASGCSASDPKILKVTANACYAPEGYNEYMYMQTSSTPWNWASLNIIGSNGNYTTTPNSGPPNLSPVANVFTTNFSIVNQLNSAIGACSTPVFFVAPNPIPANALVMVTMSSVGISGLSPGAIATLCGQGPIFVICGNFTSGGNGNFGFFKNSGCLPSPNTQGCTPSVVVNFGSGCSKTLTYNLNNMQNQDGECFLEDGTQTILSCFNLPPLTIPCTPPAAPQISNPTISTCENTTIPSSNVFTCTNCPGSYNVFTASTGGTAIYTGNNFPSGTFSNPSTTATYYIEQTVSGCTSATRTPVSIQVNPLPQAAPTVNANITCSNPTVTVNAGTTSTGANFSYAWSGPNGFSINTLTPTLSVSGTYNLTVTNTTSGCTKTASLIVIENKTPPTVNPIPQVAINCTTPTPTLSVTASGGTNFTYTWSPSGNGANLTISANGTYTVTVTNTSNGCFTTQSTTVSENKVEPLAVVASPPTLSCANPSTVLNANGSSVGSNFTYSWAGPSAFSSTLFAPQVTVIGTYTLLVTNTNNGCTKSNSVTVLGNKTLPIADAGIDKILNCNNQTTPIGGNSSVGANIIYSWSGTGILSGSSSVVAIVNQSGNYNLTVTDVNNGCTQTDIVNVTKDIATPTLPLFSPKILTCNNNQVNIGGIATNGTNFTYTWTTGATTPIPTVNTPNVYCVTVTNANNGCTTIQCVTVTEDKMIPNISIATAPMITCANPTVKLSATGSAGANITYNWSGANIVSGANTLTPSVNQAGSYAITVTNTTNGCTKTAVTTVTENKIIPTAVITAPKILNCSNPSIALNSIGTSTGANITYAWSGPNSFSSSILTPPNVTVEGTYNLTVTNTTNGCFKTAITTVTQDFAVPNAVVVPSGQLSCAAPSVVLNTTGTSIGTNFTYNWSSSNGFISTLLSPTVTIEGTYILTVTNTTNGCTKSAQTLVTKSVDFPTANAGQDKVLGCKITSVQLGGGSSTGANFTYLWSNGITAATQTVTTPNTYILTVTNTSTGCTQSDEAVVTLNNTPPSLSITPSNLTTNCANPSAILTANGTGTFLWSTGENTATISVSPSFLTTYSVTLTGNNDCINSKDITIAVDNSVKGLAASINTPLCVGQSLMLNASGGVKYLWSGVNQYSSTLPNNVIPNVTAKDAGTYSVSVTGANGCSIVVLANVIIDECTATNDIQKEKSIVIFPNPVENQLRISSLESITNVILTNSIGQNIFTKKENNKEITIEMSHFASGTYTLTVQTAFEKKVFKVVKI